MIQKVGALVIYAGTVLATGNWIEYGLWPEQPYGYETLMRVALVGTGMFGLACMVTV